jgi:hypothetical protein
MDRGPHGVPQRARRAFAAPRPGARRTRHSGAHVVEPPLRVTLLAASAAGWAHLCRMVSAARAQPVDGYPVASWPPCTSTSATGCWSSSDRCPNPSVPCPLAAPAWPRPALTQI